VTAPRCSIIWRIPGSTEALPARSIDAAFERLTCLATRPAIRSVRGGHDAFTIAFCGLPWAGTNALFACSAVFARISARTAVPINEWVRAGSVATDAGVRHPEQRALLAVVFWVLAGHTHKSTDRG
jgi:hypothetical protein